MTRHVLIELLKVFLFALVAITGLIEVAILVREAIKEGIPLLQIAWLLPYTLPEALRFSVPITLLLATTTVYSRMSGSNEVVALKALGVSPVAILWPSLAIAFLASLVTVWLNDKAVSWGRQGAAKVLINAMEEIAYGKLRTERCYASQMFTINVKRVVDKTLIRPIVTVRAGSGMPTITIDAESAELCVDHQENVVRIRLYYGAIETEGRGRFIFTEYEFERPLIDPLADNEGTRRPSGLELREIPTETVRQEKVIEDFREQLAAVAAERLLAGEFDRLTGADWTRRMGQADAMRVRLCELQFEPFRRWSAGFSCLCFVWVGAPMAIRLRNRDFLTSFFLCFAPILCVYYPLLAYGISGAKNGTIPPIAVWTGNVLLAGWGVWLLRKVMRY